MPKAALKVVLIEDSPVLATVLGAMLDELSGVEVVGGAVAERAAVELLQNEKADLAIVDVQLREGSGIGVLDALQRDPARFGKLRAVVFSSHGNAWVRQRCLALGADRFFDKADQTDDLLDYVRGVTSSRV